MITGKLLTTPSSSGSLTFSTDGISWDNISSVIGVMVPDDKLRYDFDMDIVDQNNGVRNTVRTSVSSVNNDRMPEKVVYNGDTTVLIDGDEKIVVKCSHDDVFDPVFGFLYGYFLLNSRMSKVQAGKLFDNIRKCDFVDGLKVKRVENIVGDKSLGLDDYEKMMREVLEDFIA